MLEGSAAPIAPGVVHSVPEDLQRRLITDSAVLEIWQGLTPLARNEWLCWIEDAKKMPTREKRLARLQTDLMAGKRRPCCWPGCAHRSKNGRA